VVKAAALVVQVVHVSAPVVALNVNGDVALMANVPDAFGRVSVGVPATACAVIVAVPLVVPANPRVPVPPVAKPMTGVLVAVQLEAPRLRTMPWAPVKARSRMDVTVDACPPRVAAVLLPSICPAGN